MQNMHFTRSVICWLGFIYAVMLSSTASASLLWHIEKAGRQNHILGTFHVADRDIVNLPRYIDQVVGNAGHLILEVKQDARAQQIIADRSLLQRSTLPQLVGRDLYGRVTSAMKQRGLPAAGLQRLKPWAVGLMLNFPAPSLEPVLDVSLQYRFQDAGKPVSALESIDEQLDLFDQLPLEEQIEFLESALQHLPEFDRNMTQMKQLYKAGDLNAIHRFAEEQLTQSDSAAMERLMTSIVEHRNQRMFLRLQPHLTRSGTLIAVGALHLPGKQGLLQLLKNAGYRVTPVTP